jgi:hypothetical protein
MRHDDVLEAFRDERACERCDHAYVIAVRVPIIPSDGACNPGAAFGI